MGMRRAPLILLLALATAALGACGSDDDEVSTGDPGTSTASGEPGTSTTSGQGEPARYEFAGTVLEDAGHGPMLCLGAIAESYPPQCGDVPVAPWSWDDLPDAERASGATWGDARVVGTYDGEAFVPSEVAPATADDLAAQNDAAEPDFSPVCDDPAPTDPSAATDVAFQGVNAAADGLEHLAASWVSNGERPASEWVFNVVVTEDAAGAEAELRPLWGGGLCVVERPDQPTADELYGIQERVADVVGDDATVLGSSADVLSGQVAATVVVAPDDLQARLDEEFGEGVVRLDPVLRPAD